MNFKELLRKTSIGKSVSDYRRGQVLIQGGEKTRKDTFEGIYSENRWGGQPGIPFSGAGSHDEKIVTPYLEIINRLINENGVHTIVDIGCGDFAVSRGISVDRYIGCDIASSVIEYDKAHFQDDSHNFRQLDFITDALPEGDLCTIRQVLQHLSNEEILIGLSKLIQTYPLIVVADEVTKDEFLRTPNIDKVHNSATRTVKDSGVFIDCPPFSIDADVIAKIPITEKTELRMWVVAADKYND